MNKKGLQKIILLFCLVLMLASLVFPVSVYAIGAEQQDEMKTDGNKEKAKEECSASGGIWLQVPIFYKGTNVRCISGLPAYIEAFYNLFIGIVGILAVIMIMVGGMQWLIANGNEQIIGGAKTTIVSAIMGLVIALASWQILYLINPRLLDLDLKTPKTVTMSDSSEGAYCTNSNEVMITNGEKYPLCGKSYTLKDKDEETGEDVTCNGFWVEKADNNFCVSFNGRFTAKDGRKNQTAITISSTEHGYPSVSFNSNNSSAPFMRCGHLYVFKVSENIGSSDNEFYFGTHCAGAGNSSYPSKTCVIDTAADFRSSLMNWQYVSMKEKEKKESNKVYEDIGTFGNSGCREYE